MNPNAQVRTDELPATHPGRRLRFRFARDALRRALEVSALTDATELVHVRLSGTGLAFVRTKGRLTCEVSCPVVWLSEPIQDAYFLKADKSFFDRLLIKLVRESELEIETSRAPEKGPDGQDVFIWLFKGGTQVTSMRFAREPALDPDDLGDDTPLTDQAVPAAVTPDWTFDFKWPMQVSPLPEKVLTERGGFAAIKAGALGSAIRLIAQASKGPGKKSCRIENGRIFGGSKTSIRFVKSEALCGLTCDIEAAHLNDLSHVLARMNAAGTAAKVEGSWLFFEDDLISLALPVSDQSGGDFTLTLEPLATGATDPKELELAIQRIITQCGKRDSAVQWALHIIGDRVGVEFRTAVRPGTAKVAHVTNPSDFSIADASVTELAFNVDAQILALVIPDRRGKLVTLEFFEQAIRSLQTSDDFVVETFVEARVETSATPTEPRRSLKRA